MKKRTQQLAVVSIGVLLVSVGVYGALMYLIAEEERTIGKLEEQIQNALIDEQRLINTEGLLKDTELDRAALDQYFVGSDDVVVFLEDIELYGDFTGTLVDVSTVEIKSEKNTIERDGEIIELPAKPVEELRITLSATGAWRDVFHFISILEALPYQVAFLQVNVEKIRGESGDWEALVSFSVDKLK